MINNIHLAIRKKNKKKESKNIDRANIEDWSPSMIIQIYIHSQFY